MNAEIIKARDAIRKEVERLVAALDMLDGLIEDEKPNNPVPKKKRKPISAAARKRMSVAQRKRHAAAKKGK